MSRQTGTAGEHPLDEDSEEQSKPLLGGDNDGEDIGSSAVLPSSASSKKVAEYLPAAGNDSSVVLRLLRGLYGHVPKDDVPRILWVRSERSLPSIIVLFFCGVGDGIVGGQAAGTHTF